jgi:putative SbcD/Mre11-related phosphoesterase
MVLDAVEIEPIADIPALLIQDKESWILVSDLHIGIEVQLRFAGFNIPSQTPKMLEGLEALASRGRNLIVLGDVKHKIPSVGYRENKEIGPFLERLAQQYKRVLIAAGNHDGGLASILPKSIEAVSGRGTRIGDCGMFHGHVWPSDTVMQAKTIVMGHTHPSVMLTDSLGTKSTEKCWVRGRLNEKAVTQRYSACPDELVIVPAFNPLLTGTPVNSDRGSMIGPLFRNGMVDTASLRTYLLDGTNLGRV